jgi:hypothetical protein
LSTDIESDRAYTGARLGTIRRLPWREIAWTAAVLVVLVVFAALYYKQTFAGLTDRHAMDTSQIARNIESGHGFTTLFLRPLNVALVDNPDVQFKEMNSAPLFPYAVATAYKLSGGASDQGCAWVSLLFVLLTIAATYVLGWVVFDRRVGLLAASVVGLSAPVLSAATSGTEWTMAAFWFVLLLLAVALHHKSISREASFAGVGYAAAAAALLALLYMTSHILLCLALPLAVYFGVT